MAIGQSPPTCRNRNSWVLPKGLILATLVLAARCASAPPIQVPPPTFEQKMSWILRLEDQRILREPDPAPVLEQALQPPPAAQVVPAPPVPDLVRLLGDSGAHLRRRAALAVGRVGLAQGIAPLVQGMADPVAEVRAMSAFALGLIGDEAAVEPLVDALGDESAIVQGRAAQALGLIGDPTVAPAVGTMVAAHLTSAFDVDPEDISYPMEPRIEAFRLGIYALARLKAYEPLAGTVLDDDGQPILWWWPVAYALQRIEDPRALPALRTLAGVQGSYGVAFAARGLGALKNPSAIGALLPLLDTERRDCRVVLAAIRALGQTGHPEGARALLRLARRRGLDPNLRLATIEALGALGAVEATNVLLDLLSHPWPAMRAAALRSLAQVDAETFIIVVSGLDADSDWSVRVALAEGLAFLEPDRALPRLTFLLNDDDARVIPAVLSALVRLRAPNAAAVLLEQLKNPDVVVRMAAARGIGDLQPEQGEAALAEAYEAGAGDSSYLARAAALDALAKYGGPAAVQTLRTALSDPEWAVRIRAAERLTELAPSGDYAAEIRPAPLRRSADAYAARHLVNPTVSTHAYIETDKGTIQVELNVLDAPMTVDNFVTLARDGFFDGLSFHRVVPDFVVQGGDPRGDSQGGPGYTIRDELAPVPYLRGTVGMALDWSDTGGSQFFITHSPQPHLDARYTVFGRVVGGMEVVDQLQQGDVIRRVLVWDGSTTTRRSGRSDRSKSGS